MSNRRSEGIYVSAFDCWCDCQSYAEVARQFGVSPQTAKRWVRRGADIIMERRAA